MERRVLALGVALALACASCGSHQSGRFARDAYYEELFPVRGFYADGARRQLIPGEWILLNYQIKHDVPDKPKVTGNVHYKFDTDGDGSLDTTQIVKALSLEYQHARTGAEAWFFLEPLSLEDATLDLKVLADNHVEASSGSGTVMASIAPGVAIAATRKLATRVLEGKAATIDGLPAYVITYEIANVDQLSLSQQSRWRRARLTLIRTPYRWSVRHAGRTVSSWPVIAVVGYQAEPNDFDQHLPEYAALVANLDFMDDGDVLRAHSAEILKCTDQGTVADVVVEIAGDGAVRVARLANLPSACARHALGSAHFAPTGSPRVASAQVFTGPLQLAPIVVPPEVLAPVTVAAPAPPPDAPPSAPPVDSAAPAPSDSADTKPGSAAPAAVTPVAPAAPVTAPSALGR